MLINKSILVKPSSIRCSDMELYLNATKDIKVSKFTCPCYNASGQCEYISPYKRTMISAADDTPKVQYLSIKYHKSNKVKTSGSRVIFTSDEYQTNYLALCEEEGKSKQLY